MNCAVCQKEVAPGEGRQYRNPGTKEMVEVHLTCRPVKTERPPPPPKKAPPAHIYTLPQLEGYLDFWSRQKPDPRIMNREPETVAAQIAMYQQAIDLFKKGVDILYPLPFCPAPGVQINWPAWARIREQK